MLKKLYALSWKSEDFSPGMEGYFNIQIRTNHMILSWVCCLVQRENNWYFPSQGELKKKEHAYDIPFDIGQQFKIL
jgi:hypothetical protein